MMHEDHMQYDDPRTQVMARLEHFDEGDIDEDRQDPPIPVKTGGMPPLDGMRPTPGNPATCALARN